jgi:hypothetical protein
MLDGIGDDGIHERLGQLAVGSLRRSGLGPQSRLTVPTVAIAQLV